MLQVLSSREVADALLVAAIIIAVGVIVALLAVMAWRRLAELSGGVSRRR